MGTIVDKLQAVLKSKEAIREKFNLSKDLPFSQYAKNINGGTTMEFFKCAVVGDTPSLDSGNSTDLIVSGFTDESFNGRYVMQDPTATGVYRAWVKDDIRIEQRGAEYYWYFVTDKWDGGNNPPYAHGYIDETSGIEDVPWNVSSWTLFTEFHGGTGTPVVTLASGSSSGGEEPLPEPVFNAPLSSQSDIALTGQTLNVSGEVSYTNFNGVDCVLIPDQYNYIYCSDDGFPSGDSDRTICCRMCTEGDYTAPFPFCGYGNPNQQSNFYMSLREGTFGFDTNFVGEKTSQTFDTTVWNFYAVRVKDGQVTAIVNDYKEELSHDSFYTELNGRFQIGRWCDHTAFGGRMYICDVQVYNTALSDEQLMKLYDPSYEPEAPLPPNTWNGYKAVLVTNDEGKKYYAFEETLTEGLTFGNGLIPQVGGIYNIDTTVEAIQLNVDNYSDILYRNVFDTTATANDVKQGKQFYNAEGVLTDGQNTDVDVTATTAIASDVKKGKQFYNSDGILTDGQNTDVNVSATTATASDVRMGRIFYNAQGEETQGTSIDVDPRATTATASDVLEGKKFYTSDGVLTTGTNKEVNFSATTATASDVKDGKKFYNADGALTTGTNTDVNVSATTANASDVLNGKKFYNSAGVLTTGTLVPQSGDGGGGMVFYKCDEVGPAESGDTGSSTVSTDIIVSGAVVSGTYGDPNGTYSLRDPEKTGKEREWRNESGCWIIWYASSDEEDASGCWALSDVDPSDDLFPGEWIFIGKDQSNGTAETPIDETWVNGHYDGYGDTLPTFKWASGSSSNGDTGSSTASTDIIVSNSGLYNGDGRYILDDPNVSNWQEKCWTHENGNYAISWFAWNTWAFHDTAEGWESYITSGDSNDIQDPVSVKYWNNTVDPSFEPVLKWASDGSTTSMDSFIVTGITPNDEDEYSDDFFNGLYVLEDKSATGTARVWVNRNDVRIWSENDGDGISANWYITYDEWNNEDGPPLFSSKGEYENPCDVQSWYSVELNTSISGSPVFTIAKANIIVIGCDISYVNGDYALLDSTKTGKERKWGNMANPDIEIYYDGSEWIVGDGTNTIVYSNSNADDPLSASNWEGDEESYGCYVAPTLTWANSGETESSSSELPDYVPLPAFTWNGYKATLVTETVTTEGVSEIKKYWVIEEILTTGLTYGYGFKPEVGKIYDSEAMVRLTLFPESKNEYDINANIDSLSDELALISGEPETDNNLQETGDVNVEFDELNKELSELIGE